MLNDNVNGFPLFLYFDYDREENAHALSAYLLVLAVLFCFFSSFEGLE